MKFKICGDLDAPDWILKEIELLSKMSAIKIRGICVEVVNSLCGGTIDYEKVAKAIGNLSDAKAVVAALTFILQNAARYNVKPEVASLELQQLGLPGEHAGAVERILTKDKDRIREAFRKDSLKLNRVLSVDWRVDFILASSDLKELNAPAVQLNLTIAEANQTKQAHSFAVDNDKLRVLLHELKLARSVMESLENK
uniref:COMM domain-containing protein n=1 Tax=Arcella intermedia TaxID=1963864 RepID=A0A6B2LK07_9EUKA|eukprot:TRINITY_DN3212_c0_g1_i1.p1 TRINITY_DN3212_c0_g1~~TRINITY_DN3212_c0_g1_i1.p1  ORF type:complete len:197 (-),score=53.59 TRINITY_DN3212_c0_g1_i1:11-601(-)